MKILSVLFLVFSFSGIIQSQNIKDLRKFFDYDKSQDLDIRLVHEKDTLNAEINQLVYTSANALKVTAYLVLPKKRQLQHPAVIFLHGDTQNKTAFLNEAIDLAGESFISLILDAPPVRPSNFRINYLNYSEPKKDFTAYRQAVLDVRRALDILENNPLVDRYRIAFTGIDKGSWVGALVSGVDNRILWYLLLGCSPCHTCDLKNSQEPGMVKIRSSLTSEQIVQYELQMKYLNATNFIGNRFESQVFFQFAEADPFVSEEMAGLAFSSAGEPKLEKYYQSSHFGLINIPEAKLDRKNWLKKKMK